jgi:alpha-amylase
VVDIVLNHMANFGSAYNLVYPPPAAERRRIYGKSYPQLNEPLFVPEDFHDPFCIQNYGNAQEVRDGRLCGGGGDSGLPDLKQTGVDHLTANPKVLSVQRAFLQRLLEMGVAGFRLDAIKHMEPQYLAALLKGMPDNLLIFGESIAEPNRASWAANLEPYMQLGLPMKYYDFPLVNTMRDALSFGGDLRALEGDPEDQLKAIWGPLAVTFVVNHDIPQNPMPHLFVGKCNESDRYGDPENEMLAYAFILSRQHGLPYVYSDRGVAGNDGVPTDAYKNMHSRCELVRMIQFHTLVEEFPEQQVYGSTNQLLLKRGRVAVAAINKSGENWESAQVGTVADLLDGRYINILTGASVWVSGGVFPAFTVAPRSGAMFVHESVYTREVERGLESLACDSAPPPPCSHS